MKVISSPWQLLNSAMIGLQQPSIDANERAMACSNKTTGKNRQQVRSGPQPGLPRWRLVVKNPPTNAGNVGLIAGLGRSPGGGHGNPLQYSCLENPVDRGAWPATVCGAAESDMTEQLTLWLSTSPIPSIKTEPKERQKGERTPYQSKSPIRRERDNFA